MSKIVFISGASRGIGREVAYCFAKQGYQIIITFLEKQQEAERTREECLRLGAEGVMILELDLTDEKSIENVVLLTREKFGMIDILINNAGVLIAGGLSKQSFAEISRQLRANLEGPIKLTALFAPYVRESIINIGSTLGKIGKRNLVAYCASKFGIRGFTKALAKEFSGLRVYAVNPGLTATKMGREKGASPAEVAKIIFKAATGKIPAKYGEIDVPDYLMSRWKRLIQKVLRILKK